MQVAGRTFLAGGKFSKVWMDNTLEFTQNKKLKGNNGFIGLTLKEKGECASVFAVENTMAPMSMFNEQGAMHKSKKSDFMSKLEDLLAGEPSVVEKADSHF